MEKKMTFNYFYGTEADQFSFYRIPKKTVLNLVYFEEMRQQDVADYLGIKQQSVNDLLNRALKTMKKKAENEEF